jgi:hypothetical protein
VDVTRERIKRFPGFDLDEFEKLTEDDVRRMNNEICEVCGVTTTTRTTYSSDEPIRAAWDRPDYAYPDWWRSRPVKEVSRAAGMKPGDYTSGPVIDRTGPIEARKSERVVGSTAQPSPHFEGRAQPGDVLGVETGGEETHIGDTTEDEDKRRIDAERHARKSRD